MQAKTPSRAELIDQLGERAGEGDQQIAARRDAISGVSLDEEAVELIRYQRAYEAAARFMQVLNEVTEVTLSIGR